MFTPSNCWVLGVIELPDKTDVSLLIFDPFKVKSIKDNMEYGQCIWRDTCSNQSKLHEMKHTYLSMEAARINADYIH